MGKGVSVQRLPIISQSDLILTFRQLTIKGISFKKVIRVCFPLFYCDTQPLQGFLRQFSEVETIAP